MSYDRKQYEEELKLTLSCNHSDMGSCLIPCPWCGIYGFYAAKDTPNKIVRACKWCGVWQQFINGKPYRCKLLACTKCNGTEYTKDNLNKPCRECGIKMKQIKWPIDGLGDGEYHYFHEDIKKEVYKIHQYQPYGYKISEELVNLMIDAK